MSRSRSRETWHVELPCEFQAALNAHKALEAVDDRAWGLGIYVTEEDAERFSIFDHLNDGNPILGLGFLVY